jgi:hypothetical protein
MTVVCIAVVLGVGSTHIDMDLDMDMDMDLDLDIMLCEATSTDARCSDSVCRTPVMHAAMRTCDGVTTALLDSGDATGKVRTATARPR